MIQEINSFSGRYAFLSNFFSSPTIMFDEIWPTCEHVYQGAKAVKEVDRQAIRLCNTPGQAKRLGQKICIREDWEDVKYEIMLKCVRAKFNQNPKDAYFLHYTHNSMLIEGNNWHDNLWGNCTCEHCKHIKGKNWLGKILMQVREELKRN